MYLNLTSLYLIFVVAQCGPEVFRGDTEKTPNGLGSPIDKTYTYDSSSSGEADILQFRFTSEQGGRVYITPYKGHLKKGQYDCGYTLQQSSEDSAGYYDEKFITGCTIENGYQNLTVPTASTGEDQYKLQR
ncbi:hypothetical protein FOZ60_010472 [Perkinsus olseni]|uniref:Uncharacterized protein n=1 Tax=Perkinsus olseni TaxID=32597 RepID=A0A7J6NG75_PEROL|nr:hypothetical protein FOZ60_010472 [Perkinsus olseni]